MDPDFLKSIYQEYLKFSSYDNLIEDLFLNALVDSYGRVSLIPGITNMIENEIRDKFYYDLENNNTLLRDFLQNKTVKLTNENRIIEIANYRTDIEFFVSVHGTFVIECKRLSSVDQRYIDNGVARFVSKQYSENEPEAGMLGFVIEGNITHITQTLKARCGQYEPSADMNNHINTLCLNRPDSFHSKHNRDQSTPILIHHHFFDFTNHP